MMMLPGRFRLFVILVITVEVLLSEVAGAYSPRPWRKEVISCQTERELTLFRRKDHDVSLSSVRLDFGDRMLNRGFSIDDSRFEGRLDINRRGDVRLRFPLITDQGLYQVAWRKADGKTDFRQVILRVAEPPQVKNGLRVTREVNASSETPGGNANLVTLSCGGIERRGLPPVSVVWKDPEGRTLLSSRQTGEGTFQLDLPRSSPSGNYSCSLQCQTWSRNCCPQLPPAILHVDLKPEMTSRNADVTACDARKRDVGESVSALVQQYIDDECSERWKSLSQTVEALRKNLTDLAVKLDNPNCVLAPDQEASPDKGEKPICYGIKGDKGDPGLPGLDGFPGVDGFKGEQGADGIPGVEGMKGEMGYFGPKGDAGLPGAKGERGPRGFNGIKGDPGDVFRTSCLAVSGSADTEKGTVLCYGVKGDAGEPGLPGPKGSQGLTGIKGEPGKRGLRRRIGRDHPDPDDNLGLIGPKGSRGSRGRRGPKGEPGACCNTTPSPPPPDKGSRPGDCHTVQRHEPSEGSGVHTIYVTNKTVVDVYCDQTTDGGGWTVIQRRIDGSVNFNRNWTEYEKGFGQPSGEYWLGLSNIHRLTSLGQPQTLRVEFTEKQYDGIKYSGSGTTYHAVYRLFSISGHDEQYRLRVFGYSGTAGDSLELGMPREDFIFGRANGMPFSTHDNDNDLSMGNCADLYKSGWWYSNCLLANHNGHSSSSSSSSSSSESEQGPVWFSQDYSFQKEFIMEMKIRPHQA